MDGGEFMGRSGGGRGGGGRGAAHPLLTASARKPMYSTTAGMQEGSLGSPPTEQIDTWVARVIWGGGFVGEVGGQREQVTSPSRYTPPYSWLYRKAM